MIYKGRGVYAGPDGKNGWEHGRGYNVKVVNRFLFGRFRKLKIALRIDGIETWYYQDINEVLQDWELIK